MLDYGQTVFPLVPLALFHTKTDTRKGVHWQHTRVRLCPAATSKIRQPFVEEVASCGMLVRVRLCRGWLSPHHSTENCPGRQPGCAHVGFQFMCCNQGLSPSFCRPLRGVEWIGGSFD